MIYRKDLNRPLSAQEVDQNFQELVEKYQELENQFNRLQQTNTSLSTQSSVNLHQRFFAFQLDDRQLDLYQNGQQMASIALPFLCAKGNWSRETSYVPGDVVAWNRKTYLCCMSHHSQDFFEVDQWSVLCACSCEGCEAKGPSET